MNKTNKAAVYEIAAAKARVKQRRKYAVSTSGDRRTIINIYIYNIIIAPIDIRRMRLPIVIRQAVHGYFACLILN